jgi:tyrosinase
VADGYQALSKGICGRWNTRHTSRYSCYTIRAYFSASLIIITFVSVLLLIGFSNVDRLFSMYQTAHPERMLNPESVGNNGNVYIEDNQVVDGNTQLLPFRRSDGNGFWTTNDVNDTLLFGYAYPETSLGLDAGAAIAKLYSSSARTLIKSTNITVHAKQAVTEGDDDAGALSFNNSTTYTDYFVQGSTENALGTFSATFYFNAQIPGREPIEVGSWVNAVMQQRHDVSKQSNGTTSLTSGLMDRISDGDLESLDARDVVPYLKAHLEWTIRDVRIDYVSHSVTTKLAYTIPGIGKFSPCLRFQAVALRSSQQGS